MVKVTLPQQTQVLCCSHLSLVKEIGTRVFEPIGQNSIRLTVHTDIFTTFIS
jgi:hypothetical protein